jgi:hypothetical protein
MRFDRIIEQNDYFCDDAASRPWSPHHCERSSAAYDELATLSTHPTNLNFLKIIQKVIDDPLSRQRGGGNLQYGTFKKNLFQAFGILEVTDGEGHCWRGALDMWSPEFDNGESLLLG